MEIVTLKIKITKDSRGWVADCVDLPGSPLVGIGTNAYEAIGSLISVMCLGNIIIPNPKNGFSIRNEVISDD